MIRGAQWALSDMRLPCGIAFQCYAGVLCNQLTNRQSSMQRDVYLASANFHPVYLQHLFRRSFLQHQQVNPYRTHCIPKAQAAKQNVVALKVIEYIGGVCRIYMESERITNCRGPGQRDPTCNFQQPQSLKLKRERERAKHQKACLRCFREYLLPQEDCPQPSGQAAFCTLMDLGLCECSLFTGETATSPEKSHPKSSSPKTPNHDSQTC